MASPKKKRLRYLLDLPGASPVNGYIKGGLKTEQEEAEALQEALEDFDDQNPITSMFKGFLNNTFCFSVTELIA